MPPGCNPSSMNPPLDPCARGGSPVSIPEWSARGKAEFDLPPWVAELVLMSQSRNDAVVSTRCLPADELEGEALTDAARAAFLGVLGDLPAGPCRVWSFLPRPTDRDRDFLERYMRFNAGRTAAYRAHHEQVQVMPAGTCVGHSGGELVVHALWTREPFVAVENPRQRPAYLYSSKFGPVPPAFTRAARLSSRLLASGTASVVGEESMHPADVTAQFDETLRNLSALSDAGGGDGDWRDVCVYVRDRHELPTVRELCEQRFKSRLFRVVEAAICRRELLLEIEAYCYAC